MKRLRRLVCCDRRNLKSNRSYVAAKRSLSEIHEAALDRSRVTARTRETQKAMGHEPPQKASQSEDIDMLY